jgi:16S rRNA (guanine966-N2)-methyltransferase
LTFPPLNELRPTPDRVRETLFNWLQESIRGAKCLDLFSGSGALGLEALSRDAERTIFIEQSKQTAASLQQNLDKLCAVNATVIQADALQYLSTESSPMQFDIVFLDPPFGQGLISQSIDLLEKGDWLADKSYVYMETEKLLKDEEMPKNWTLHRNKRAGKVSYQLAIRDKD